MTSFHGNQFRCKDKEHNNCRNLLAFASEPMFEMNHYSPYGIIYSMRIVRIDALHCVIEDEFEIQQLTCFLQLCIDRSKQSLGATFSNT